MKFKPGFIYKLIDVNLIDNLLKNNNEHYNISIINNESIYKGQHFICCRYLNSDGRFILRLKTLYDFNGQLNIGATFDIYDKYGHELIMPAFNNVYDRKDYSRFYILNDVRLKKQLKETEIYSLISKPYNYTLSDRAKKIIKLLEDNRNAAIAANMTFMIIEKNYDGETACQKIFNFFKHYFLFDNTCVCYDLAIIDEGTPIAYLFNMKGCQLMAA